MVLTVNARAELCQASRSRGVGGGEGRAPTSGRGGDCDEDDAGRDGPGEGGCEDEVVLEDGKVVREDVEPEVKLELKMLDLKMLLKLFVKMPASGRGGDCDEGRAPASGRCWT